MANLVWGTLGTGVQELKRQLNRHNPTRLPRLKESFDVFDTLTQARVMEFQYRKKIGVDGIAGKKTFAKLSAKSTPSSPTGRCIVVSLIENNLIAFIDGLIARRVFRISGGSASHPTRRGVFPMSNRRLKNHTSSKYPIPPGNMDFSLFFDGAIALHQGPPSEPSHGCIHVGKPHAESLFKWAGKTNVLVIVAKLTK